MYVCVCAYFLLFFLSTFNKICGKWKPSAGKGISLPLRSYFTLPTSKDDAEKPWQAQDRAACSIRMPRPTAACPSPSLCRLRSARPGSASRPLFYVLQTSHTNNGNGMLAEPEPEPPNGFRACASASGPTRTWPSSVTFSRKRIYCNASAAGGFRLGAHFKAIGTSSLTCTCLCCHYS